MMLAAIIATPFVLAIAIMAWCLCRTGRLNDEAAAECVRRYREHEADDAHLDSPLRAAQDWPTTRREVSVRSTTATKPYGPSGALTVREARDRISAATGHTYSEGTVRNWVRSGKLKRVPSPVRQILISEESVERLLRPPQRRRGVLGWWRR